MLYSQGENRRTWPQSRTLAATVGAGLVDLHGQAAPDQVGGGGQADGACADDGNGKGFVPWSWVDLPSDWLIPNFQNFGN